MVRSWRPLSILYFMLEENQNNPGRRNREIINIRHSDNLSGFLIFTIWLSLSHAIFYSKYYVPKLFSMTGLKIFSQIKNKFSRGSNVTPLRSSVWIFPMVSSPSIIERKYRGNKARWLVYEDQSRRAIT